MNVGEIRKAFGGRLVGTEKLKQHVCHVVVVLPLEFQRFITKYVWFVGSMDDAWAYAFTGNDLIDQHLVFLSDDLLNQDTRQIQWSIAHEIGHVILGHKNNIFIKQSKKHISLQEKEADQFARKYVGEYFG